MRLGEELADRRRPQAEREHQPLGGRGRQGVVVERRAARAAQHALGRSDLPLEPRDVRVLAHAEKKDPRRVEAHRELGRDRPVHGAASDLARGPPQDRDDDALDLRPDGVLELVPGEDARVDEGATEGLAGLLRGPHRLAELGLADLPRPVEHRAEPILLERRGGEGDLPVDEVEALADLDLPEGEDARPAVPAGALDLVDQHRPPEVLRRGHRHGRASLTSSPPARTRGLSAARTRRE
ncbi:MAG: hypothetical protein U0599_08010 [Vicinamibacteria bacterium]